MECNITLFKEFFSFLFEVFLIFRTNTIWRTQGGTLRRTRFNTR